MNQKFSKEKSLGSSKLKILLQPQSHEDSESVELSDKSRPKEATFLGNENCGLTPQQKISSELERYLQTPQLDTDGNSLPW